MKATGAGGNLAPVAVNVMRSFEACLRGADVFVEPADGERPGLRGGFRVVTFRSRVAIEAVNRVWPDVAFVGHIDRREGLVVGRPRRGQARIERAVMGHNRRFDLGDLVIGRDGAVVGGRSGDVRS